MPWYTALWCWVVDNATVFSTVVTAISTGVIACFTIRLARATNEQGRLTQDSVDLARQEFAAVYRPKIEVRQFDALPGENDPNPFIVKFCAVNTGVTPADIFEWNLTVLDYETAKVPALPEYGPAIPASIKLASGETHIFQATDDGKTSTLWFGVFFYKKNDSGPHPYAFGYIRYRDGNGTIRKTGFGREYDGTHFIKIEGVEYDYAD